MVRRNFFVWLALSSAAIAPTWLACSSNSDGSPPTGDDAGGDALVTVSSDAGDGGYNFTPEDSSLPDCLLYPREDDPVGLCIQKAAILGVHSVLTEAGVPAAWSVDTFLPVTDDAGAPAHDVHDDVAYGAALSAYAASAAAYKNPDIQSIVSGDLATMAHLVETELATLPSDYDGSLYLQLRRFAAGLRAANLATDATAIDTLALNYGKAIYTTWFHPVVAASMANDGGGSNDGGGDDDGGALDAATGAADGGATTDGILGSPSGADFAYRADKAASGALALMDLATRATNGTLLPVAVPPDSGIDGAAPTDAADALAWSQAASAVLAHLKSRARDTSGLYFTTLQTSGDVAHDAVTDDGSFLSETQGAVALAFVRTAALVEATSQGSAQSSALAASAASLLQAIQTLPALWDPTPSTASFTACNSGGLPTACGSGYFLGFDSTKKILDSRKSTRANAYLFSALARTNLITTLTATTDLVPMRALFTTDKAQGTFFTAVSKQSAYLNVLTEALNPTVLPDGGTTDGGAADPLGRTYSAAATAAAIESMNDQWLGYVGGTPSFFQ